MRIVVEHTVVATGLSYEVLVTAFERELARLDPGVNAKLIERSAAWSEVEAEVGRAAGRHGLMILGEANQGALVSLSGQVSRCRLYLVGNPVVAAQIIGIDVRASFYVPFRVALYDDGAPGGASIGFDRPSSFLGALGRPELAAIGEMLDRKIDGVVAAITPVQPVSSATA